MYYISMKITLITKFIIYSILLLLTSSCALFPKSENKYKYLEGKIVRLKYSGSMYESDSTITSSSESYVIKGVHQFPDINSIYIPAGTKMYIDKMKHVRTIESDHWYAAGKVYLDGEIYNCAYGMHHSYLEVQNSR
jgi:hypothetical protein